ncbi:transcription factor IIIC subunit delta N-term-domain-containing protein [Dipodascopsis tothii]|uniref:transcription factor IIIC subunit delta N-term-domain-containing protein n=1 Tax=Dipodascopsis tothii TaxID=44089 RepID=UPI0034CDF0A8
MIPDLKLSRVYPSNYGAALRWSADGRLAVAAEGVVEIITPRITKTRALEAEYDYTQAVVGGRDAGLAWTNCVQADPAGESDSLTDVDFERRVADVAWSPSGIDEYRGCLLAVLTTAHRIAVYSPGRANPAIAPWTAVHDINALAAAADSLPSTDVTELAALRRLRFHAVAWSHALGPGQCLLASGNEHGEIVLWRVSAQGTVFDARLAVSQHWIKSIKLSVPAAGADVFFLAAATAGGELVLCALSDDGSFGESRVLFSARGPVFFEWARTPEPVLVCTVPGAIHVFFAAHGTALTHDCPAFVFPTAGIVFAPDALDGPARVTVTAVSVLGHTETVAVALAERTLVAPAPDDAAAVERALELRARVYVRSLSAGDGVTAAETRVFGVDSDHNGDASVLYTLSNLDRLKYPINSKLWSRVAFLQLREFDPLDLCLRYPFDAYAPRRLLWTLIGLTRTRREEDRPAYVQTLADAIAERAAAAAAADAPLAAVADATELAAALAGRLLAQSLFWRRLLLGLLGWAAGAAADADGRAYELAAQIQVGFMHAVAAQAVPLLEAGGLAATPLSARLLQLYARLLILRRQQVEQGALPALARDSSVMTSDALRMLHYLRRAHGHDIGDELRQLRGLGTATEHGTMVDNAIIDQQSQYAEDEPAESAGARGGGGATDACIACGAEIGLALDGHVISRCGSGHVWDRCAVTQLPLVALGQRQCAGCGRKAVALEAVGGEPADSFARLVLDVSASCLYCGERYFQMGA